MTAEHWVWLFAFLAGVLVEWVLRDVSRRDLLGAIHADVCACAAIVVTFLLLDRILL